MNSPSPFYISKGSFTVEFETKVLHGLPVMVSAKILTEPGQRFKYIIDEWKIVRISGGKINYLGIPWVGKKIDSSFTELCSLEDKILAYIKDLEGHKYETNF